MALTHTAILKASATATAYKLSDGDGLHLLVKPGGSKFWRYRYMGKENMLALGSFPEVSLAAARTKRDDAKKLLAAGTDPSEGYRAFRRLSPLRDATERESAQCPPHASCGFPQARRERW